MLDSPCKCVTSYVLINSGNGLLNKLTLIYLIHKSRAESSHPSWLPRIVKMSNCDIINILSPLSPYLSTLETCHSRLYCVPFHY